MPSHSFTRYFFNNLITSEYVNPSDGKNGESGWLLKEKLMQTIAVPWDFEGDVGQMTLIKRVK